MKILKFSFRLILKVFAILMVDDWILVNVQRVIIECFYTVGKFLLLNQNGCQERKSAVLNWFLH